MKLRVLVLLAVSICFFGCATQLRQNEKLLTDNWPHDIGSTIGLFAFNDQCNPYEPSDSGRVCNRCRKLPEHVAYALNDGPGGVAYAISGTPNGMIGQNPKRCILVTRYASPRIFQESFKSLHERRGGKLIKSETSTAPFGKGTRVVEVHYIKYPNLPNEYKYTLSLTDDPSSTAGAVLVQEVMSGPVFDVLKGSGK